MAPRKAASPAPAKTLSEPSEDVVSEKKKPVKTEPFRFKLSALRVNPTAMNEGIWNSTPFGFELLLARMNNPAYIREWNRTTLANADSLRVGRVEEYSSEEEYEAKLKQALELENILVGEVLAKTVLLGWKNLADDDDEDIPYSVETATKILNDPELVDLRNYVVDRASDFNAYRQANVDEAIRAVKPQ